MGVRAKFYVSRIELFPGSQGGTVHLQAVSRGDRNAQWAAATPSGTVQMTVNNPAGLQWFLDMIEASRSTGRQPEVFVDFEHATDGWPGDGHAFRLADVPEEHYIAGNCGECGMPADDERAHPAAS